MSLGPPGWVKPYIGIPFVDLGFDEKGCHCWGLVRLVFKREFGVDLPKYSAIKASELRIVDRAIRDAVEDDGPWQEVEGSRMDFDVIIMRPSSHERFDLACHVGIAVGASRVLHVKKDIAAVCVPTAHHSVKSTIVKTYRHRDLP